MAQNVIVPIIDLTSAAEGSSVPQNLQTAIDYATTATLRTTSGTTTVINNTGFWSVRLSTIHYIGGAGTTTFTLDITDGTTPKTIWQFQDVDSGTGESTYIDLGVVFLRAGDSLTMTLATSATARFELFTRQIADINGVLINPLGFNPQ